MGIVLRWFGIGSESLWFDEGFTWWMSGLEPSELLHVIRKDVSAPLYLVGLHYWRMMFGDSEAALRSLSAVAASVSFIPFWLILKRATQSHAARLAGLALFSLSYMQVQYAQEARFYAMLSLELLIALYATLRLADRRSTIWLAVVVLSSAYALYAHNMAAFYLPAVWLAWLIAPGERLLRKRVIDAAITGALVLLLYAPWMPVLREQMTVVKGQFWASRPDAETLVVATSSLAGVDAYSMPSIAASTAGLSISAEVVAVAVALGVGLVVLVAAFRSRMGVALTIAGVLPVILVFIYSQVAQPVFGERVLIASSAVLPILFAIAVDRTIGSANAASAQTCRRATVFIASVLGAVLFVCTLVSIVTLLGTATKEDWRGAQRFVASLAPTDRRLIVFVANEGELAFSYYASRDPTRKPDTRTGTPAGFFDADPPVVLRRVQSESDLNGLSSAMASGRWDQIVLIQSHEWYSDPKRLTEARLAQAWQRVQDRDFRLIKVQVYEPREPQTTPPRADGG